MTIGEKIKKARMAAGMSQQELADRLEIKCAGISQWETDKRTPKTSSLLKIAEALGIGLAELLGLPPEDREKLDKLEKALLQTRQELQAVMQDKGNVSDEVASSYKDSIEACESVIDELTLHAKLEHQADLAKKRVGALTDARGKQEQPGQDIFSLLLQENLALEFPGLPPEQKEICVAVCRIADSEDERKSLGELLSFYKRLNGKGRAELIKRTGEMLCVPGYAREVDRA